MPKKVRLDKPEDGVLGGVSSVDRQVVLDIQRIYPGWNTGKDGMKVNDISPLWPFTALRELLVKHCRMFIEQEERAKGLIRVTNETDFLFYGPLRHVNLNTGMKAQEHNVRSGEIVRVPTVVGQQVFGGKFLMPREDPKDAGLCDFKFYGRFAALTGYINEEPKQIAS